MILELNSDINYIIEKKSERAANVLTVIAYYLSTDLISSFKIVETAE